MELREQQGRIHGTHSAGIAQAAGFYCKQLLGLGVSDSGRRSGILGLEVVSGSPTYFYTHSNNVGDHRIHN